MFGEWQHRRVGGVPPPTATSLMLSMSICLPQRLLDTDFSTELTSQKQSTDELCEVLNIRLVRRSLSELTDRLIELACFLTAVGISDDRYARSSFIKPFEIPF